MHDTAPVNELVRRAQAGRILRREEKVVLFYAVGLLDEGCRAPRHSRTLPGLSLRKVQRQAARLKPAPISCLKIRELLPEITASVGCNCSFDLRGGRYPSPVLHAAPHLVPVSDAFAPPENAPVRDVARRYIDLRLHLEEMSTALGRLERELDARFQKKKIHGLKIDRITLTREEHEGRVAWRMEEPDVRSLHTGTRTSLHREGDRLVAKKDGRSLQALHLFKLDQLVLFGSVFLTPAALSTLLDRNIDTVFMTASGRYRGRLQPPFSKNISLRRDQFGRLGDERFGLEIARSIVSGKLANARTMLLRLNRSRQELDLDNAVLSLKQLSGRASEAEDMDILRAWKDGRPFFISKGSRRVPGRRVTFRRRVRRPPTDPVNALLSLGYTFLFNAVMASVSAVGFDPYLGCLHCVEYGRPSLALDLMEEWRPVLVDSLVLSVFNLGILTLDDFVTVQASEQDVEEAEGADPLEDPMEDDADRTSKPRLPVRLTDSGFRKFITQWERKINERIRFHLTGRQLDYRGCIEEQVRHLARVVRGEEDRYRPMPWK